MSLFFDLEDPLSRGKKSAITYIIHEVVNYSYSISSKLERMEYI